MSDRGPRAKPKRPATKAPEPEDAGSFPISTRLSESQKKWVEEAAAIKGWSPANFIRQAAVDKAIHVLNTSRPNKFAFNSYADRVARQLCRPEISFYDELGEQLDESSVDHLLENCTVESQRISDDQLVALREAVRLGGAEFVEDVLNRCAMLLEPESRADLPDPIRPE